MPFTDRTEAGRRLAERLHAFRGEEPVVLGLPRGGVPVAFEVARALRAPLDVIVVRKLGVPYQPELALGAIGERGVRVLNHEVVSASQVTAAEIIAVERAERVELQRRVEIFRDGKAAVELVGRTVLIIDDGVATGSTARAACQVARALGAVRVVLAVPVGAREAVSALSGDADEVVCLETPTLFFAVGAWYADFQQTTDDDVAELLHRAAAGFPEPMAARADDPPLRDEDVELWSGSVRLLGHLTIPEDPVGLVLFAHGSGSSRHSPRNRYVARVLNQAGLGTMLFDLLTPEEELSRSSVFDIELLASRLVDVTRWLVAQPDTAGLRVGYFGTSTGAGAALWAAADPRVDIAAVVSRGGRPDLAGPKLASARTPALLLVGGDDEIVLDLNRRARGVMRCVTEFAVVPGATHLFEEPGALHQVATLARDWFITHLAAVTSGSR